MSSSVLITILVGLPVLGVLIFVHELGHFLAAKLGRVAVLEFAIGFGRVLWSRRIGETRYCLRLIPLGGFVRMAGDDPLAVAEQEKAPAEKKAAQGDAEKSPGTFTIEALGTQPDEVEAALAADSSRWFLKKGFLIKSMIVLAGPFFNMLFAWILSVASYFWLGLQIPLNTPEIGEVFQGMPAEKAGLQAGDRVLAIDGVQPRSWEDLARTIRLSGGAELTLRISRSSGDGMVAGTVAGTVEELEVRVQSEQESEELAALREVGSERPFVIGIRPPFGNEAVGLWDSLRLGTSRTWYLTVFIARSIYLLFRGSVSPKHIGGPITIMRVAAGSVSHGWDRFIGLLIILSLSLAVLNLLPIPVLDGGHLLFFVVELVRGRPLGQRAHIIATQIGMTFILLLMVFALGNDIWRMWSGAQ